MRSLLRGPPETYRNQSLNQVGLEKTQARSASAEGQPGTAFSQTSPTRTVA